MKDITTLREGCCCCCGYDGGLAPQLCAKEAAEAETKLPFPVLIFHIVIFKFTAIVPMCDAAPFTVNFITM